MSEKSDAREALIKYLASIFPGQPQSALQNVAEHQIAFLKQQGFKLAPLNKVTDLDA